MSRGLTDPVPTITDDENDTNQIEIDNALNELYTSQNMIHDRLVRLEREVDAIVARMNEFNPEHEAISKASWLKGTRKEKN